MAKLRRAENGGPNPRYNYKKWGHWISRKYSRSNLSIARVSCIILTLQLRVVRNRMSEVQENMSFLPGDPEGLPHLNVTPPK